METARTKLYVSIALIPAGLVLGFLSGGLGLFLMVTGWIGVLIYDGPANGTLRFGPTLNPEKAPTQNP
jgi:hypothetical protein